MLKLDFDGTIATIIYCLGMMLGPFSLLDACITLDDGDTGIGFCLAMMIFSGVASMSIVLLKDYMVLNKVRQKFFSSAPPPPAEFSYGIDEDVKNEVLRIRGMSDEEIAQENLFMRGVSKKYKKFQAVNQMHLVVGGSECFGLLGNNVI